MIHDINEYVQYFDSVRKRTMNYVEVTPSTILEWRPSESKFSTGELLRHLGSTQLMFLNIIAQGEWTYPGHESRHGESIEKITQYLQECHNTFREGLGKLGNEQLTKKVPTLHGHEVSTWRILMACVEHEIHHRGQLSTYLQNNNIEPPQIFGLKIEQVNKK